jgi:2-polyprenyl-3-methyl-5-hydroxy-6-metoxy-1,4-benzoquinol methylase
MNNPGSTRPSVANPADRIDYSQSVQNRQCSAKFPDGTVVPITSGRACRFPFLRSSAPDTSPLYLVARAYFNDKAPTTRVLDVGCGSGIGTDILACQFDSVLGIDSDLSAIAFANKLFPDRHFQAQELESHNGPEKYGLIFVCDLLGLVLSPLSVLNHLRSLLASDGSIFVAEPLAYSSQSLIWPSRRAFSRRALTNLLGSAGFRVEKWLVEEGTYVGCVAVLDSLDDSHLLVQGADAQSAGDAEKALSFFQAASKSENREVALEAVLAEAGLRSLCGDGDGAVSAYLRAASMSHLDPRAKAGLSQISCEIGEFADALSLADSALRVDPTDVSSACARALALEKISPPQAIFAWRLALALAPDNVQIAIRLARMATKKSERLLALWAFSRGRQYGEPQSIDFYLVLIETLRAMGRTNDANTELALARRRFAGEKSLESL